MIITKGRTAAVVLILKIWESFRPFGLESLLPRRWTVRLQAGPPLDRLSIRLAVNDESDKGSYLKLWQQTRLLVKKGGNPNNTPSTDMRKTIDQGRFGNSLLTTWLTSLISIIYSSILRLDRSMKFWY